MALSRFRKQSIPAQVQLASITGELCDREDTYQPLNPVQEHMFGRIWIRRRASRRGVLINNHWHPPR